MSENKKHDVFQAIADSTRREMLMLLSHKEMPLNEITDKFPITRTAVSKHLHVLLEAELVTSQKIGRETRYSLSPLPLLELKQWLAFYDKFWDNKLDNLKNILENDD